jgi:hypothetical protein
MGAARRICLRRGISQGLFRSEILYRPISIFPVSFLGSSLALQIPLHNLWERNYPIQVPKMRFTPFRILSASPPVLCNNRTLYFSHSALFRSRRNGISLTSTVTALPFVRMMSSASTRHLFAVYAPDYTEPGVLDHRLSVREKHLKAIEGMIDSGTVSAYVLSHYILVP